MFPGSPACCRVTEKVLAQTGQRDPAIKPNDIAGAVQTRQVPVPCSAEQFVGHSIGSTLHEKPVLTVVTTKPALPLKNRHGAVY